MANENKLQDIIKTSLENIKTMIDANTVIGDPINTASGTVIIPISKISMGFATGGLDYGSKKKSENTAKSPDSQNFGAGGGTGLSIVPVGFLAVGSTGDVEFISVNVPAPQDPVEQVIGFIDRSPEIISKIKDVFKKNKSDADNTENVSEIKIEFTDDIKESEATAE